MAVSCLTFSFYPDPDTGMFGVVWQDFVSIWGIKANWISFSHDYISGLHSKATGKKIKTFKEWNAKGYARLIEDIIGYAQYVDQETKESSTDETGFGPESNQFTNFEVGPGMLPLLPKELKGVRGGEVAKHATEVIRSYFTRHYHKSVTYFSWIILNLFQS